MAKKNILKNLPFGSYIVGAIKFLNCPNEIERLTKENEELKTALKETQQQFIVLLRNRRKKSKNGS